MKKSGVLITFLLSINFVSAAYGSFTNFSLDGFINNFDTSLFLVAMIFLAIFGIVYKSIEKTNLINNRAIQAIIAFGASAFAMYGILQTNINFESLIYSFGLPEDFIRTAIPIIIVLVFIILWAKIGFGNLLMIIGSLLIAVGLFDLVYSKGLSIAVGIALFLMGIPFAKRRRKKREFKRMSLDKQWSTKKAREEYKRIKKEKRKNSYLHRKLEKFQTNNNYGKEKRS